LVILIQNHFSGNNNIIYVNQTIIVVNPPAAEAKKVEVKKPSLSLWDRLKNISGAGSSVIDFIKKFYPFAIFFLSG
jgi:hypothetical protein